MGGQDLCGDEKTQGDEEVRVRVQRPHAQRVWGSQVARREDLLLHLCMREAMGVDRIVNVGARGWAWARA